LGNDNGVQNLYWGIAPVMTTSVQTTTYLNNGNAILPGQAAIYDPNDVVGYSQNVVTQPTGQYFGYMSPTPLPDNYGQTTITPVTRADVATQEAITYFTVVPTVLATVATDTEGELPALLEADTATADSYFIASGVRRSLASQMNGLTDIPATIVQEGQADIQTTLNLNQLFSPKFEVPADSRLLNIQPPIQVPIEVQPLGIPGQPASIPLNQVRIVPPGGH
jgi:hypothetical protein